MEAWSASRVYAVKIYLGKGEGLPEVCGQDDVAVAQWIRIDQIDPSKIHPNHLKFINQALEEMGVQKIPTPSRNKQSAVPAITNPKFSFVNSPPAAALGITTASVEAAY